MQIIIVIIIIIVISEDFKAEIKLPKNKIESKVWIKHNKKIQKKMYTDV